MQNNLVIVESPAKAKTIEKFLGKDYLVKSSFGHIRDIAKTKEDSMGVDIANGYLPNYEVSSEKTKVVSELKKLAKEAQTVWLASDEDREGEAIAWHLYETLKLDTAKTKRIVFHEITQNAILNAIKNPRGIDVNLVNAQQARRVLDRLVGFELSPLLWRKVKPSLSAGRVQSVAVKLIVEREREIINFVSETFYRVMGYFVAEGSKTLVKAELSQKFKDEKQALAFLEKCKTSVFKVSAIEKKPAKKTPAPPFTTSTLQQEASRKLGFSVSQTMLVAQRLYEEGLITYMRTDSVNLSETAIGAAKETITKMYGKEYLHTRQFTTKSKGAQEAHEAIRPTYLQNAAIAGDNANKRLYDLIWKRTIASQMSDAELERTRVDISISNAQEQFTANGEVLLFDGFLRVYLEGKDEEEDADTGMLPPLQQGQALAADNIQAVQRFTQHPPRYTEASLVKKMEELGIGRPSTYAPTISTIAARGYVSKEDRNGNPRPYKVLTLRHQELEQKMLTENTGAEKSKLFPSDTGMVVTDYLSEHFKKVMDYNFTAKVEEDFDEIAEGKIKWNKMIDDFYKPFHQTLEDANEHSDRASAERILGADPKSGKPLLVRLGRFGPIAQIGSSDDDEKPRFANLRSGQHIESITFEEALKLFDLPRIVGQYEGKDVQVAVGRFGPYVRHDSKFTSLKRNVDDPMTITLERAIELIEEKRETERNRIIKTFAQDASLQVLNGRYGPYFVCNDTNYKIPKTTDPASLTYEQCLALMDEQKDTAKKVRRSKKATPAAKTKTTATKTATKKKTTTVKKKVAAKKK
ncbi:DNA topoisomerase 1 [Bacteroidia bacterium]|nr:DNA topoisomerase 1 [Bacteroidia bacterium]